MNRIVIDSFAGGGGASTGIEWAIGRHVDIAINHDPEAIRMHKTNHPFTNHYCEDVWEVDPIEATKGKPVDLFWLSPDCKHFSKAKGSKPKDKKIRGLAWIAVKWAKAVHPRLIILENVEEFQTWGPLDENGSPIKEKKGQTFMAFKEQLRKLGYTIDHRELKACDYGAPTSRKRFYMICVLDGKPKWPEPTHGNPESMEVLSGLLKPWRTASEIIDWSIPCQSIFDRKKPLCDKTLRRIARGIKKFAIDNSKLGQHIAHVQAFLIKYYGQGTGQSIKDPLDTIVSKDRFGLVTIKVEPYQFTNIGMRMLTPRELFSAQGFPDSYIIDRDFEGKTYSKKEQVARVGNSVVPQVAEALVGANLR